MRPNPAKLLFCLFLAAANVVVVPTVSAHGSTGEYAGTHAVAFIADPQSPFVGENVSMEFYLRDLRRIIDKNPFSVSVKIHEVASSGEEKMIFSSVPEIISGGIYKLDYTFLSPGRYSVEYNFWPPENPDVVREAIFAIEARNAPIAFYWIFIIALASLVIGGLIGASLKNIARKIKNGK